MSPPILPSLITCFHSSFSHIRISFPLTSSLSVIFITVIDSLVYPVCVEGQSMLLCALCSKSSSPLSKISLLHVSPLALIPYIPLNWVFSKICDILAPVLKQVNTIYSFHLTFPLDYQPATPLHTKGFWSSCLYSHLCSSWPILSST